VKHILCVRKQEGIALKKNLKRTAIVASVVALAGVLSAGPAAAATSIKFHGTEAQVDNNPGNGAAGWVWVYGSTEYRVVEGFVEYKFDDGVVHVLRIGRGKSASRSTSSAIQSFRACTFRVIDGFPVNNCGEWYEMW
jgi:hypothetical protein